jgi:hypothetical protein
MVKSKGFQNVLKMGHSADDDLQTKKRFLENRADLVEKNLFTFQNLKKIIDYFLLY